jgi:hypothetical protein
MVTLIGKEGAMKTIAFTSLPLFVRLSALATWFMAWLLFAELVIDRHGLDTWLPYYRVGNFCPYDVAVIVALGIAWFRLNRPDPGGS